MTKPTGFEDLIQYIRRIGGGDVEHSDRSYLAHAASVYRSGLISRAIAAGFEIIMRRALVILVVLAALPALFGADPALIDGLVSRYDSFGTFNGSVLVAANGEVVFKKGYGLANREWGIPNQTDTRFRLGSITKQFTATLILRLVAEGKVRLDGSLAEYVPEYPEAVAKRVTIHQLLTPTSGIKS